ncbi:MAG: hypothetical protein AAF850_08510 [Pseudomonadota bacterium]
MKKKNTPHCLQCAALFAEIIGAGAVVASVIYLALQINSNNKRLEAQSYFNFFALGHLPMETIITNPQFAEVMLQCDATPCEVTPAERRRCGLYYFMQINRFEYAYYQQGSRTLPQGMGKGL